MTLPARRAACRPKRSASRRKPAFPKNVLVLGKKTQYDELVEARDEAMLQLVHAGHESMKDVLPSHEANATTLAQVHNELRQRKIKFKAINREQLGTEISSGRYDLIVAVGGDGTVLDASHFNDTIPILGVVSAVTSYGHFCVASRDTFGAVLDRVISGERKPLKVLRLELTLDGKVLPQLVLNELCLADPKLGATSRYILHVGDVIEEQKSDGFFVGTAAGCTGWMHSYDADVLPVENRQLQFLARGLIINPGVHFRFQRGLLPERTKIRIVSKMVGGLIKIDGQHIEYKFPRGSELTIKTSKRDLLLYCDPNINAAYEADQRQRRETVGAWH